MYNSKTIISMKKILLSISAVTAMIAMTATFSACSSDDEQQSSTTATLVINASRGDYGGGTRAIKAGTSGEPLFYWETTGDKDNVFLYKSGWTSKIGELTPQIKDESNPKKTKLDGPVTTTGLKVSDRLELIMPRITWSYTGQDGTLATISKNYDYAIADATILYFDESGKLYASNASFKSQQAIVRFTLKKANNDPLDVKTLSIVSDENGKILLSRDLNGDNAVYGGLEVTSSAATNQFYVAIRNDYESAVHYTLTAVVTENGQSVVYSSKSRNPHNYINGKYYAQTVTMTYLDDTYTERDGYETASEEW